ncbi:MAG: hypothetical protein K0R15_2973 [Clostridiales bacterium]|jgi:hypothetical protein|nr:hypothetical protein [Clostridiales bacterium]
MKKRFLTAGIVMIVLLVVVGSVIVNKINDDKKLEHTFTSNVSESSKVVLNITEQTYEISELLKMADMVAEVKITKEKERGIRTFEVEKVDAPIIIYEAEIIDYVKGEQKSNKIDLIIPDVTIESFAGITVDNTYFLYLCKNTYYGDNAYSLLHFSQGTFKINDSNEVLFNSELVKLETLKDMLLEMKID